MTAHFLFENVEVSDPAALARSFPQAAKFVAEHGGHYSPWTSCQRSWREIPALGRSC